MSNVSEFQTLSVGVGIFWTLILFKSPLLAVYFSYFIFLAISSTVEQGAKQNIISFDNHFQKSSNSAVQCCMYQDKTERLIHKMSKSRSVARRIYLSYNLHTMYFFHVVELENVLFNILYLHFQLILIISKTKIDSLIQIKYLKVFCQRNIVWIRNLITWIWIL